MQGGFPIRIGASRCPSLRAAGGRRLRFLYRMARGHPRENCGQSGVSCSGQASRGAESFRRAQLAASSRSPTRRGTCATAMLAARRQRLFPTSGLKNQATLAATRRDLGEHLQRVALSGTSLEEPRLPGGYPGRRPAVGHWASASCPTRRRGRRRTEQTTCDGRVGDTRPGNGPVLTNGGSLADRLPASGRSCFRSASRSPQVSKRLHR